MFSHLIPGMTLAEVVLTLWTTELRFRQDEYLVQGHTAGEDQSQDLNPGMRTSKAYIH